MAEASALLLPLPGWIYVVSFGVVCTAGQVFLRHTRYVSVLKWLTLTLFAYFGTVAVVKIPWDQLLTGLFIPTLHFDRDFWLTVVAILGTTISPYLFFWQAAQEVEDTRTEPRREPLLREPAQVAVLNGIVAVPVMVLLMLMSVRQAVMGQFRIGATAQVVGWAATGVMAVASGAFFVSLVVK